MIKVDVFVKASDEWTTEVWRRRQRVPDPAGAVLNAYLPSAEDAVLQKIRWFEMGGGVSDRQWSDVLGMVKTRGESLDRSYLRKWAGRLGLSELLESALGAANAG